jgi:hypothetical protein
MSERQETVHVVLRFVKDTDGEGTPGDNMPSKVFDDRKDALGYAKRARARSKKYGYFVTPCKKG